MSKAQVLNGLSTVQRDCLQKFRHIIEHDHPLVDDYFLYRFLKARNFDLTKAEYMIREHFKFRHIHGVDTILQDFQLPEVIWNHIPYRYLGEDVNRNGVFSVLLGRVDWKGIVHCIPWKEHIKSLIYIIEDTFAKMRKETGRTVMDKERVVVICDLQGIQILPLLDRRIIRYAVHEIFIYDRNYPEVLEAIYVINVPAGFHSWFNVFKTIARSEALNKIRFYGTNGWQEDLLKIVDARILPAIFGGHLLDPDGSTKCETMFTKGGKVPKEVYANSKYLRTSGDAGVQHVIVRENAFFNEEVFIREPGTVIKWSFETVDSNIGFAVYLLPSGGEHMLRTPTESFRIPYIFGVPRAPTGGYIEIVPLEKIDSHFLTEDGSIYCEDTGTYILHFDNTYSWVTAKELSYKIDIIPPAHQTFNGGDIFCPDLTPSFTKTLEDCEIFSE